MYEPCLTPTNTFNTHTHTHTITHAHNFRNKIFGHGSILVFTKALHISTNEERKYFVILYGT